MLQKLDDAVSFIRHSIPTSPRVGIVLGSGLGPFTEQIENKIQLYLCFASYLVLKYIMMV